MVNKWEETSLVPEIRLHNKLKCSLKALLLPLLSIHIKPKTVTTDFRARSGFLSLVLRLKTVPLGNRCHGPDGAHRGERLIYVQ